MKSNINKIVVLFFLFLGIINAYKHHLEVNNDDRKLFAIEGFGFGDKGTFSIKVTNWTLNNGDGKKTKVDDKVAFFLRITDSDTARHVDEYSVTKCDFENEHQSLLFKGDSNVIDDSFSQQFKISAENDLPEGFYTLYYKNCNPSPSKTTFKLVLEEYNIDSKGGISWLPIGNAPLPTLYTFFSLLLFATALVWVLFCLRGEGKRVNLLHHLCTAYLVIQAIELLFEAIEQHYIKLTGSANGWNVAYYIFAFAQGSFFIILLAMIGSGWYFIKPFLSDKEKKIFMIVIPLQILDNIALIVVDEESRGAASWISWSNIFIFVDLICCLAIIVPIVWSMNHLKDSVDSNNDKVVKNIQKLRLFRSFYLVVICYLYFTRVIIYLLKATLPYKYIWLGEFFSLAASFAFYCITGYQFRPSLDNPYFYLPTQDDDHDLNELRAQLEAEDGGAPRD
ncbi:hypothetical protein ACTFIZ_011159 [Dictyostelium cf. discoideum]